MNGNNESTMEMGPGDISGEETTAVEGELLRTREVAFPTPLDTLPDEEWIAERYELRRLLGKGGMGEVYQAHDHQLDELIAIKLLRHSLLEAPEAHELLKQEVKIARKVTDRHVARTFDLGVHNGNFFLTMEYIEGESLASMMSRRGILSLEEAVDIGVQICLGLQTAHEAQVIHRDLKPGNVLIEKGGRVAISDFGIARLFTDAPQEDLVGTPAYMAPEQFQPDATIDNRVDIYALGVILFRMLTATRPWGKFNPTSAHIPRLSEPPPNPRERNPALDKATALLITRCMATAPQDRFLHAKGLGLALKELLPPQSHEESLTPYAFKASSAPQRESQTVQKHFADVSPYREASQTIAVLPFRNDGHEDDAYLCDGVTEDLIDTLSMVRDWTVSSWGMVQHIKPATYSPAQLGDLLGVQMLLTGSFRRLGELVQLRTRLISCADGMQHWAKRFQCSTAQLFDLVEDIAVDASQVLAQEHTIQSREQSTQDPVAIDLYFRAKQALRKYWFSGIDNAVEQFEKALSRSPNDPLILSGTAVARARQAFFDDGAVPARLRRAKELVQKATQVAPERADPLFAMALIRFVENKPGQAIAHLKRALAIIPTYAEAHDLMGRILLERASVREAVTHLQIAITLDPQMLSARWDLFRGFAFLQEWDKLDALAAQPLEAPRNEEMRWMLGYRMLLWKRDLPLRPLPKQYHRIHVGEMIERYHKIADGTFSQEAIAKMLQLPTHLPLRIQLIFSQQVAEICAYYGRDEDCLNILQFACKAGLTDLNWLRHCPLFERYQALPRYQTLVQTLTQQTEQALVSGT